MLDIPGKLMLDIPGKLMLDYLDAILCYFDDSGRTMAWLINTVF